MVMAALHVGRERREEVRCWGRERREEGGRRSRERREEDGDILGRRC
jgi:hypothetical protein